MRLILIGPPGAGKGTQGARLSERLGVPSVSTGTLLRQLLASGEDTPLVREARQIEQGAFVSDAFANQLAFSAIAGQVGFVLDGYPRSVAQAAALASFLGERQQVLDAVLIFTLTAETLSARLLGRRVCGRCGATYHLSAAPPCLVGQCDRCGGALVPRREDDQPEKIALRQHLYETQTAPLIRYYQDQGLAREVLVEGSPEVVFQRICELLLISV